MKRILFFLFAAVLVAGNTLAQDKPMQGSWSTEVQINPFEKNGNTFSLDGLKVRYFFSDKDALRLKVSFSSTSNNYTDKDNNYDEEDATNKKEYKDDYKTKTGHFSIDLGYERHFDLAKRLDAYIGASVGLGKNFASTKIDSYSKSSIKNGSNTNTTETISNEELKNGAVANGTASDDMLEKAERASFNINGAIFAGLDFYIYKGLYIGTELGIGCQTAKSLKMEFDSKTITKTTVNGSTTTNENTIDEKTTNSYRVTNFKSYIEPKLRIGITF